MNTLKYWRIERGLSQFELSEASGVPRYAIQLAEQGVRQPSHNQQAMLGETLGTAVKDLFSPQAGADHE